MDFHQSTHRRRWLYSKEKLVEVRELRHQPHLDTIAEIQKRVQGPGASANDNGGNTSKKGRKLRPPSLIEEAKLLKYYESKIRDICRGFGFPNKVVAAAIIFLKRFYLTYSTLEHDPKDIVLTTIYLAGKVEEAYIGAEDFCRRLKQDEESVLNTEPLVLSGLNFDLIIFSPYTSLSGYFMDLKDCQAKPGMLEAPLQSLSGETLAQAHAAAIAAADALLLTDAPLLFPPGQLALAAMRSGFNKVKIPFGSFLDRVASKAAGSSASADSQQSIVQDLRAAFNNIDAYGAEGSQQVNADEVRKIDRRLKACIADIKDSKADNVDTSHVETDSSASMKQKALEDRGIPFTTE